MKDNRIKAVMPDMDGKPVYVRSEEEKSYALFFPLSGSNSDMKKLMSIRY